MSDQNTRKEIPAARYWRLRLYDPFLKREGVREITDSREVGICNTGVSRCNRATRTCDSLRSRPRVRYHRGRHSRVRVPIQGAGERDRLREHVGTTGHLARPRQTRRRHGTRRRCTRSGLIGKYAFHPPTATGSTPPPSCCCIESLKSLLTKPIDKVHR